MDLCFLVPSRWDSTATSHNTLRTFRRFLVYFYTSVGQPFSEQLFNSARQTLLDIPIRRLRLKLQCMGYNNRRKLQKVELRNCPVEWSEQFYPFTCDWLNFRVLHFFCTLANTCIQTTTPAPCPGISLMKGCAQKVCPPNFDFFFSFFLKLLHFQTLIALFIAF